MLVLYSIFLIAHSPFVSLSMSNTQRITSALYIIYHIIKKFVVLLPLAVMNFGTIKIKDGSFLGKDINLELNVSSFIGIIIENIIRLKRCLMDEYFKDEFYPQEINLYQMDNHDFDTISLQKFSDVIDPEKYTVLYFGSCS